MDAMAATSFRVLKHFKQFLQLWPTFRYYTDAENFEKGNVEEKTRERIHQGRNTGIALGSSIAYSKALTHRLKKKSNLESGTCYLS